MRPKKKQERESINKIFFGRRRKKSKNEKVLQRYTEPRQSTIALYRACSRYGPISDVMRPKKKQERESINKIFFGRRRKKSKNEKVLQRYTEPRQSTIALYRACSRYRCVPKMASSEVRKCECTTAPQGQESQNPGSEPSVGRVYYGATGPGVTESWL